MLFAAAAAGTAGTITAATVAAGTADALFAAFLGPVNVEGRTTDNDGYNGDDDVIDWIHRLTSFRSAHTLP